ncbi:MAG: hypothetical protein EBR82_55485 [Caulobacteraceae bacterium]|nr:hypothetical protein [Caulobacteraceae bacterium]
MIAIAADHNAWRPLGYISLDAFLISEANFTQAIIDAVRNAKKGAKTGEVIQAARVNPLPSHGGDRRSSTQEAVEAARNNPLSVQVARMDQVCNASLKYGTVEYTLRRLARDKPELLDKIEAGELSVNQAAIQAGIRKKPTPEEQCVKAFRKSQSRLVPLKVIVLSLEPHELSVIADWVKERLDGRRLD